VSEAHKRAVVASYVEDGLRRGERVALYTRGGDGTSLLPALGAGDATRLVEAGQLVLGSAEQAYFPDGGFDGAAQATAFEGLAESALAEGFAGLRVYADNGFMPAMLSDPLDWLEYELRISALVDGRRLTGLCGFDAAEPAELSQVLIDAVHPERVGQDSRPSLFHVSADRGGLALAGELDFFCVDDLLHVLAAARPLLTDSGLSLSGLQFVDGPAACALARFVGSERLRVRDVPFPVHRVWELLDVSPGWAGS
jgi:hypothetical protein